MSDEDEAMADRVVAILEQRQRDRNLRIIKHEIETPMRDHDATCCIRAALG